MCIRDSTELYLSLQDRTDPNWYQAQKDRAELDTLLPPPLPGLTTTQVLSVENARVVGDKARVEFVRLVEAQSEDGERVPFRAVRFYRFSDDGRWLHTRADQDYAGHTVVFVGERVKVTAFHADREWVEPIVPELVKLTRRFCDVAPCRWDTPLLLDLTGTLSQVGEVAEILPAPFIVGRPADQAAQEAWESALRELLLDRLISRETGASVDNAGGAPGGGELLRARLVEWLRAKVGLSTWVSPNLDSLGQAFDMGKWVSPHVLWYFKGPLAEGEINLMLTFVEETYGPSAVVDLLRSLPQSSSMKTLVEKALDVDYTTFEDRYMSYVHVATGELPGETPAFATYDLVGTCEDGGLWGLRLDQPTMTVFFSPIKFEFLAWSPNGDRLLAWRRRFDRSSPYLLEADGSGALPLTSLPGNAAPHGTAWSPHGSRVVYYIPGPSLETHILDLESGESIKLEGEFRGWSPDGSHLIYARYEDSGTTLWLAAADGSAPRRVGEGRILTGSPDGTRLAYLSAGPALKLYDLATGETTTVLDKDAFYDLLELSPSSTNARIQSDSLVWSPTDEWIALSLSVYVFSESEGTSSTSVSMELTKGSLALVRPDGSRTRSLFTCQGSVYVGSWSPDGRWIAGVAHGNDWFATTLVAVDGTTILETDVWSAAWSPDGRYLAAWKMWDMETDTETDRALRIMEVASGTSYSFEPADECIPPAWNIVWNPRGPLHDPVRPGSGEDDRTSAP